jgi:hypothetical protein
MNTQLVCWGCNRIKEFDSDPQDLETDKVWLAKEGWHQRVFGPGAEPWFCSHACAYESRNAKRAEVYWAGQKDLEENPPTVRDPEPPADCSGKLVWGTGDDGRSLYLRDKLVGRVTSSEVAKEIVEKMNGN